MLDLRIELGADDDDDRGDPEPGHEAEDGTERSVSGVIRSERRDVPGEKVEITRMTTNSPQPSSLPVASPTAC
jgi:hypothetical protein